MKRFIRILSFLLVISLFVPGNAYAASKEYENCEIVYYDDGSYMVIETTYITRLLRQAYVSYRCIKPKRLLHYKIMYLRQFPGTL